MLSVLPFSDLFPAGLYGLGRIGKLGLCGFHEFQDFEIEAFPRFQHVLVSPCHCQCDDQELDRVVGDLLGIDISRGGIVDCKHPAGHEVVLNTFLDLANLRFA